MNGMHFGVSVFPQYTTWDAMRSTGLRVEELGYDSLWTWDHFLPIFGDPTGPNLEGWQVLAAWGATTSRVKLGALVSGNTYRHPAVLANMAATLDHITSGRAIVGLGAAWYEREHVQYGIPFETAGHRLARMDEAAQVLRSLLDQSVTTFEGKHYQLKDAYCEPKPLQTRLPLMIGGGGERKTLRTVARYADQWNGFGTPQEVAHKLEVLRGHCADVGRDPAEILSTVLLRVVIRDSQAEVDRQAEAIARTNRISTPPSTGVGTLSGTPQEISDVIVAYYRAGVRGVLLGLFAPYDLETLDRFASQVKPRVLEAIAEG